MEIIQKQNEQSEDDYMDQEQYQYNFHHIKQIQQSQGIRRETEKQEYEKELEKQILLERQRNLQSIQEQNIEESQNSMLILLSNQFSLTISKSVEVSDIYKVQHKLGQGGQARIRQAKHRETGQRVAIKFWNAAKLRPSTNMRIGREVEIMKKLNHKNVVRYFDWFEDERYHCIIMELLEGTSFVNYISQKQKISENITKQIIKQLIEGVDYCHSQNVVHRDIKPDNIMVKIINTIGDEHYIVKLCDFGIATILEEGKQSSTLCGTIDYLAPEQVARLPYGRECDFWAIGVTTFVSLTGTFPFEGSNDLSTQQLILKGEFNKSSKQYQKLSDEAKDFLSKTIQPDIKKRFNTQQMLAHPWLNTKFYLNQQETV